MQSGNRFILGFGQHILVSGWLLMFLFSCTDTSEIVAITTSTHLTAKAWMFDQALATGGGYRLDFQRGKADDPFKLANVRVKFNEDGTITGSDNAGSPIKNGVWKLIDNDHKITVLGTNVFGIDGTSAIDKLDGTSLTVSNILNVPQLGDVSIKGVLVHE